MLNGKTQRAFHIHKEFRHFIIQYIYYVSSNVADCEFRALVIIHSSSTGHQTTPTHPTTTTRIRFLQWGHTGHSDF